MLNVIARVYYAGLQCYYYPFVVYYSQFFHTNFALPLHIKVACLYRKYSRCHENCKKTADSFRFECKFSISSLKYNTFQPTTCVVLFKETTGVTLYLLHMVYGVSNRRIPSFSCFTSFCFSISFNEICTCSSIIAQQNF